MQHQYRDIDKNKISPSHSIKLLWLCDYCNPNVEKVRDYRGRERYCTAQQSGVVDPHF